MTSTALDLPGRETAEISISRRSSRSRVTSRGSGPSRAARQPGSVLGNYELEKLIGAGGMGEVYAARHVETDELVALKTLSRTSATHLYRFKREFRALADVAHPNLVRLHELAVVGDGDAFFTMELIDGLPFIDWVRGTTEAGELPDLARLEHALRGLFTGVHYLHAHEYIHRDLKPSNVLVTPEGRVVILDFGLVSELTEPDKGVTRDGQMLGTPAYMAPEQARGEPAGTAADYYAIGVMLYECLTGRLPYDGSALQILVLKQEPIERLGELDSAPQRLRELCFRLLAYDPEARPSAAELGARLSTSPGPGRVRVERFVGRKAELETLRAAYAKTRAEEAATVVHVYGRSGNGKTALCNRFRAELPDDSLVFHGRCRQRETVPYKGVDAIVDALSAHLRRLERGELERLRPRSVEALAQVFPVLDELWPATDEQRPLEPSEARGVSWAALREVIRQLARTTPLVLHIDDLQWADADSINLLHALVRPPRSPAILLLLTSRDDVGETEALRTLAEGELLVGAHLTSIELGPLPEDDARELARLVARERPPEDSPRRGDSWDGTWADSVALRSGGIPFFIEQLVLGHREGDSTDSDLDQIVVRRIIQLDEPARALLDAVAVSGGPLARRIALALCPEAELGDLELLCEQGLLVGSHELGSDSDPDKGGDGRVETAHERIREVVLGQLDADELARLHLAIGEQLLATSPRPLENDAVFAIVDHLDAGTGELAQLADDRRLELAELNLRAGDIAFGSAAWIPARRYYDVAYRLIEPWLPDARAGGDRQALCMAIAFGRARAEDMCETGVADAAYDDLLGWSLSPEDYGRVAVEQVQTLSSRARFAECLDRGVASLVHLGARVRRKTSMPGALLSLVRGWRAVARLDRAALQAMPDATDGRARAIMGIAAATAGAGLAIEPPLALALLGLHARLLVRHGYHERGGVGLILLSVVMAALGKSREAVALGDQVLGLIDERPISATAWTECWVGSTVGLLPRAHPLRTLAADVDRVHLNASETGQRRSAEWIANIGTLLHLDAGTPLPTLAALVEEFRARSTSTEASEATSNIDMTRRFIRILVEGPEQNPEPTVDDFVEASPISTHALAVRQMQFAVLFGDYERAWPAARTIAGDYQRILGGLWLSAMYAMLAVIIMVERWPEAAGSERRRMRRAMKKCRRYARRRAADCRENYEPMAELIDAEFARLDGRFDAAVSAYERAAELAAASGMLWLSGLASDRLARLDRSRGRSITTKAAFAAAREAYAAWGATALVAMIDAEAG